MSKFIMKPTRLLRRAFRNTEELRKYHTQAAFAKFVGCSVITLQAIEAGRKTPDDALCHMIGVATGVSPQWLKTEEVSYDTTILSSTGGMWSPDSVIKTAVKPNVPTMPEWPLPLYPVYPGVPATPTYPMPQIPQGPVGWTCPRCGRGLSPYTSSCPCVPLPPPQITC